MVNFVYTDKKKTKQFSDVPENYNELSADQLIAITSLFIKGIPKDIAELQALKILLRCSTYKFFSLHIDWKARFLPFIQWVFKRNMLTAQIIPKYDHLYGPAGEFDNLTMKEWNSCEIYYDQLVNDKDESALNYLVAVLYREPKKNYDTVRNPDGDIRVPFNPNELDFFALKVKQWPAAVKNAILTWFDGCREMIRNTYDVFDKGKKTAKDQQADMFEVIRVLSGQRFGSFSAVENMNVHLALREMELLKKEAKEIEDKYKSKA